MSPTIGSTSDLSGALLSPATNTKITHLPMALANTEYSHALQTDAKIVQFQLQSELAKLQFAFTSGDSGTIYITLPHGTSYEVYNVQLSGKTLYVQSDKASQTLEILEYY